MKKSIFFYFIVFMCAQITAQPLIESINSKALNSKRSFKIKLPKNYDAESSIKHPLIIVLDGDYLFNPVVGQTDFQTYFDNMPSSIIVGIMHENSRLSDTYHDEITGLPMEQGAKFYEFIGNELIPHIDEEFNTSNFRVVVGHDLTANLMNSFMLKDDPVFQAYVNISPEFVGDMSQNVVNRMTWLKKDVMYYMATASEDVKSLRSNILMTDNSIKEIDNTHLNYYFDDFEEDSHYSLVTRGIARGFEKVFDIYGPITDNEVKDKVLGYEGTLDKYIEERYSRIKNLFGIEKSVSEEELKKVVDAALEREDLKSLEKLGRLANSMNPSKNDGTYYLALLAEKNGKNKKAMKLYESALELDESLVINKALIQAKVKDLKEAVGSND